MYLMRINRNQECIFTISKHEAIHITKKQKVFLAMRDWFLANIMWYMFWIQRGVHYFDPNKFSPPNPWNVRLLSRIGSFSDLTIKINSS